MLSIPPEKYFEYIQSYEPNFQLISAEAMSFLKRVSEREQIIKQKINFIKVYLSSSLYVENYNKLLTFIKNNKEEEIRFYRFLGKFFKSKQQYNIAKEFLQKASDLVGDVQQQENKKQEICLIKQYINE